MNANLARPIEVDDIQIPEPSRSIIEALMHLDCAALEKSGGAHVMRSYVPGEFWPNDPPPHEAAFYLVEVYALANGLRVRTAQRFDSPPFDRAHRRATRDAVDRILRRRRAS